MTNIDTMPPGPELDAMVAERVMGWRKRPDSIYWWEHERGGEPVAVIGVWLPSTNVAAAIQALERIMEPPVSATHWRAGWRCGPHCEIDDVFYAASDHGLAHAISLAALKAVAGRETT